MHTPNDARRRVLKLAIACLPALATSTIGQQAEAEELKPLLENDPAAKALGYVTAVAKVDPKTNPMFKPGSLCSNCLQYQGKAGATSGPCTIFPGKTVAADGWCRVWVKKP